MASEHEKLVEDVATLLDTCNASNGGDSFPSDWMPEARAIIALIAERTKEATERMRAEACDRIVDAYPLAVRDCWSAMHAASALWPSHGTDAPKLPEGFGELPEIGTEGGFRMPTEKEMREGFGPNFNPEIDAAELARLREIAQNATPGPWDYLEARTLTHIETAQDSPAWGLHIASVPKKATANAAHIAAFDPPTVLSLIEALEKARGDSQRHKQELRLGQCDIVDQRDSARALLREASGYVTLYADSISGGELFKRASDLRARVAKELSR